MTWFAGLLALGLALVHTLAGRIRFLRGVPRSRWLSAAGGVSTAYIFVHVLPDLAAGQQAVRQAAGAGLDFLEIHIYLLSLVGLMAFYGLERLAKRCGTPAPEPGARHHQPGRVLDSHHILRDLQRPDRLSAAAPRGARPAQPRALRLRDGHPFPGE